MLVIHVTIFQMTTSELLLVIGTISLLLPFFSPARSGYQHLDTQRPGYLDLDTQRGLVDSKNKVSLNNKYVSPFFSETCYRGLAMIFGEDLDQMDTCMTL